VAAARLKRARWIFAAAAAAIVIIVLASHGRRPDPGLVRFQPAGVTLLMPPERLSEVVVSRGNHSWRFTRSEGTGWKAAVGMPPLSESDVARLESGLRFLHASAPLRVMTREELTGTPLAELGLDPPRFAVSVRSLAEGPITVEFGELNPQGLAQYAHVIGRTDVLLLPSFVGEAWQHLIGGP
jgi:hypothetical protein